MFHCFTRTFWAYAKGWPNNREPKLGRKHTLAKVRTEAEAQAICRRYNNTYPPGPLSRKAEYREV